MRSASHGGVRSLVNDRSKGKSSARGGNEQRVGKIVDIGFIGIRWKRIGNAAVSGNQIRQPGFTFSVSAGNLISAMHTSRPQQKGKEPAIDFRTAFFWGNFPQGKP